MDLDICKAVGQIIGSTCILTRLMIHTHVIYNMCINSGSESILIMS